MSADRQDSANVDKVEVEIFQFILLFSFMFMLAFHSTVNRNSFILKIVSNLD